MKKHSLADYLACRLFQLASFLLSPLPVEWVYFIGRRLGDCLYCFDPKHRSIAYANIRRVLSGSSVSCIRKTTVKFYRNFGQNIIELFIMGRIDEKYIKKYITIEGFGRIAEGRKKGKGVIFPVIHAGSWELANIVSARSGYPYAVIVRGQEFPRLNRLLNQYRKEAGARIIDRDEGIGGLIRALKNNEAIAITIDQGGKIGERVEFFGKTASMSSGAIKLGLKYDSVLLPVFVKRINGPYAKITINDPLVLKSYQSEQETVRNNLQDAVNLFEGFLKKHPEEYLWTYKVWKYSDERKILILSDGKTGHLRQSESLAKIITGYLKEKGLRVVTEMINIRFSNKFSRIALLFSSFFAGKYACQGCSWCLKTFLDKDTYGKISFFNPDIIVSTGSSVAPINYVLSREYLTKSILIMKPAFLSPRKFSLVIMPRHDQPPVRKNIVVIDGALNLIDAAYLKDQAIKLRSHVKGDMSDVVIGLLIGGDTKNFTLPIDIINEVIKQVKSASEKINADILVTTSRRTSASVEKLIKDSFLNYPRCKLLIIANENNIPEAVGGILGISSFVVTSPESISMLSEAASCGKNTFVFRVPGLSNKHSDFINNFARNNFIKLVETQDLALCIDEANKRRLKMPVLDDNGKVREALGKLL